MFSSVGDDGAIIIWNGMLLADVEPVPLKGRMVLRATFSPDSRTLAASTAETPVTLLDLQSRRWRELQDPIGSSTGAGCLVFDPDGKTLVVGENSGKISIWDTVSARRQATLSGHPDHISALALAPDGQTLASSGSERVVRIWDLRTHQERALIPSSGAVIGALVFSADSRWLALADGFRSAVRIWDMDALAECAILSGAGGMVEKLAISPDGRILVAADLRGGVALWNLVTFELSPTRLTHNGVSALAFAPDGRTLATGGFDGSIHLWDWPFENGD